MRTVAVIGGGASGMMAAVTAASGGAHVILLEHKYPSGTNLLSFRGSVVPVEGHREV